MILRPPKTTRTDPLFPYTTLFRSILSAGTMLGPMALNIFIPSMPGMTAVFDTDYGTIQLTLTLYLAGLGIAQLFMGPLSDRFGRRPDRKSTRLNSSH